MLFAKEIFDFDAIESLLIVCKSHGAGRQYRTLAKHLPQKINVFHMALIPTIMVAVSSNGVTLINRRQGAAVNEVGCLCSTNGQYSSIVS